MYPKKKARNVERDFRRLFDRIFKNKFVKVDIHREFGRDVLMRLDLKFMPKECAEVYGPPPLLPDNYRQWLEDATKGNVQNMRDTMHFLSYEGVLEYLNSRKNPSREEFQEWKVRKETEYPNVPVERFELGGQVLLTDALLTVVRNILVVEVGYKEEDVRDPISWDIGLLLTKWQNLQDPHIDYQWSAIKMALKRQQKSKVEWDMFPWSLDWPLTDGGLRLAFYGPDKQEGTEHGSASELLNCPFGKALLWRGDAIHAGCLKDLYGGSGLRLHAYVTLHDKQIAIANDERDRIEWNNSAGVRYSEYILRPDGTPHPKGNAANPVYV